MAQGQQRNTPVIPQAAQALEQFKYEVSQEIASAGHDPTGLLQQFVSGQIGYGGDIPSRVWGAVGGHMVRRMIAAAEESLVNQASATARQSFQQQLGSGQQITQHFQTQTQPMPKDV